MSGRVLSPGVVAVVLALALAACAGDLEAPERFLAGSTSASCASGLDVERELFAARCGTAGCHDASDQPSGGLDLVSADVASRLVGVASTCGGRALVDPESPSGGVLLEKLTTPLCGARMPLLEDPLTPGEIACVRAWAAEAAGAAGGTRDGGMGGGGDAGPAGGGTDGGAR